MKEIMERLDKNVHTLTVYGKADSLSQYKKVSKHNASCVYRVNCHILRHWLDKSIHNTIWKISLSGDARVIASFGKSLTWLFIYSGLFVTIHCNFHHPPHIWSHDLYRFNESNMEWFRMKLWISQNIDSYNFSLVCQYSHSRSKSNL